MSRFLAAALQMNSQPDLHHSMDLAYSGVDSAAREGASFIGLPENFAFLGDEKERHRQADHISDAVIKTLPEWARAFRVHILGGGFPVRTDRGKIFNRAILVGPDGTILAQYDKIHLFDITLSKEESYRESDLVEPGMGDPVVCETPVNIRSFLNPGSETKTGGQTPEVKSKNNKKASDQFRIHVRIGLSICYDVRFPELYRRLAEQKADVLCVPAAFTQPTGKAHWEILLRCRAIENTCYVIAPTQTGLHGSTRKTHGHAMIIDPWGRILCDAGVKPGMAMAEIDLDHLYRVRRKMPSLEHRLL
ncbi:MAG: carbon-nitrogen hydrolase family protein [Balneolales bacterium]